MKTQQRRKIIAAIALGCLFVWDGLAFCKDGVNFRRDVAPILQRRCLSCHNSRDRRGGLSLESAATASKGGDSGKVIDPGKPLSSSLLELLIPTDGISEMPKGEAHLSALL